MSLNGLDDAKVTEAYQGSLAEAGGWFLLKYVGRDTVELLARGSGGATETRAAIAHHTDISPLYGFLLYRRRKVLIKYLPEGISRLVRARVAVHFTTVTEKFHPYDTELSIASAEELSDAALTSACSLHTAALKSTPSNASSKLHRLTGITEATDEGQGMAESSATSDDINSTLGNDSVTPGLVPEIVAAQESISPLVDTKTQAVTAETLLPTPRASMDTLSTVTTEKAGSLQTMPGASSLYHHQPAIDNDYQFRLSSQTVRPVLSESEYADIYAKYNSPKIRLGPRPKAPPALYRPHSSGDDSRPARPVSSLPSGLRTANRKKIDLKRPKSRDSSTVPSIAIPLPPVPQIPDMPVSPGFPPKSPRSVRSLPAHAYASQRGLGVTQEKQRLMKALELRKKQMKLQQERKAQTENEASSVSTEALPEALPQSIERPSDVSEAAHPTIEPEVSASSNFQEPEAQGEKPHEPTPFQDPSPTNHAKQTPTRKESPSDLAESHMESDDVQSGTSTCSPTSAETHGSSIAPSTRPSSLSGDELHSVDGAGWDKDVSVPGIESDTSHADEEASEDSTPTVVAESSLPPKDEAIQDIGPLAASSTSSRSNTDVQSVPDSKRGTVILKPVADAGELSARRQSNRQSVLTLRPLDTQDDLIDKKPKRRSRAFTNASRISGNTASASADNSEAEYLSDDSFMDELQSAKFEEAVAVSPSPMSPFFSRKPSMTDEVLGQRSASQPYVKTGSFAGEQTSPRKASGPWIHHANSDNVVTAKKINVSSGISQRIRALAEKSKRDSLAPPTSSGSDTSTSFVNQRKSSFFVKPFGGANQPATKPVQRFHHVPFLDRSSAKSSPRVQTPTQSLVALPKPNRAVITQQEPKQSDSVQVTARIVRNSPLPTPTLAASETNSFNLRHSTITIDRPPSHRQSPVKMEHSAPSSPAVEVNTNLPRSSSEHSWRSFGRRQSESKNGGYPRSPSVHSQESIDDRNEKKDKSRTSKLFKRMSSIGATMSRKNTANELSPAEEEAVAAPLASVREPPPPVQIGDLNIQFPDTLLWKRRWVEIDNLGNLILSLSKSSKQTAGVTKRYHLTEFRVPYLPDLDQQELPNSVVIDFIDGRTLQCACETYTAQANVLQILREAHDAWRAFAQAQ